jgi:hypothetical protein
MRGVRVYCLKGNSPVDHSDESVRHVYQAPTPLVVVFYVMLLIWSVISISLIQALLEQETRVGNYPLFMIGFILFYMWYFSLGISYRVEFRDNGEIQLKSLRRTIRTIAGGITVIELPRMGLGFIRFRLKREKAYLFGLAHNVVLQTVLAAIKKANSDITIKRR